MSKDGLLEVRGLEAGYGRSQVLFDLSLSVPPGRCVTLLGRNGMGKTTTLKTIMGLLRPARGEVLWRGQAMQGQPPHAMARAGIGLVPEGRQVFPNLSVRENLLATAIRRKGASAPWSLDRVHQLFPRLAERASHRGNQLSGGEQQMLAIGRALMTQPALLILDEATEGLAPLVRQQIWQALAAIKAGGTALLVVDKHLSALMGLADHHYVIEKGRIVWQGDSSALRADPDVRVRHLGT
nr:ABC transporter ATP-binding protein [uncultured Roseateles sp.]